MLYKLMLTLRTLIFFCTALIASSLCWSANDRALFWKLTGKAQTEKPLNVYILGSLHLATSDIYPLRDEIHNAFINSDELIVELDITRNDHELSTWMKRHGMYTPPDSLRNHISAKSYQRLENYLEQESLPRDVLLQQRPPLLAITLSLHQLQAFGLDPNLGLDKHFLSEAHDLGKNVRSLENITDQLNALFNFPDDELVIEQALDQAEDLDNLLDDMITAWKTGDSEKLGKLLVETDDKEKALRYRPLIDALFYQRNHRMVDKLDSWFKNGGNFFIVVGSGHLVGDQNIIDLLKGRGYFLEQL